ncbi:MAG: hypothetical protein ACK2VD_07760 [Anaerolineae bacterium]
MSERPIASAHPLEGTGRRGAGAAGQGEQADGHDQAAGQRALADQVADRVYELLQEELRLERERSGVRGVRRRRR